MSQQSDFNDAVLDLLEALVKKHVPYIQHDEPKHGIEGDELSNLWHKCFNTKPESQ